MPQTIYRDIATRTKGEIYIGVAGPVRTGKSTFIKRFMDTAVIPNMQDEYSVSRAIDELPQSASGKTVMTTEPKFIPNDGAKVKLSDGTEFKVKLIDCVGYIVPGALGLTEEDKPRMVMTPWSDEPVEFEKAAEEGTSKVIRDHSTVGLLVTTDGSFSELDRESYVTAEERVANEMKQTGKPFSVILNSQNPKDENTLKLADELSEKYGVPVRCVNCKEMTDGDIDSIMQDLLYEFPISELNFTCPDWLCSLPENHPLRTTVIDGISERANLISRLSHIKDTFGDVTESQYGTEIKLDGVNPADGSANLSVQVPRELFYTVLSGETGLEIQNDSDLVSVLGELASSKSKYTRFENALRQVEETGYGIVTPDAAEMTLEEPEIVKQAGSYGVRLRASAPSIHLMRADIKAEVSPIVGSEKQSEDIVKFLLREFEEDPTQIWQSNLFGKTLHELINESLNAKLAHMPNEARKKLCHTLTKIINDGAGGLICILL